MTDIKPFIEVGEGWAAVEKGIQKLTNFLEGKDESPFTFEDCKNLNSIIHDICSQNTHDIALQLYEKYRQALKNFLVSTILPALREIHDEDFLIEFHPILSKYKEMVRLLSSCFDYLDECLSDDAVYILSDVGNRCLIDVVYSEIHIKARDAALNLFRVEREGGQIDEALLKDVLLLFVAKIDIYEDDFEPYMLKETAAYYSSKASMWIKDSCPDYMLKCEECLKKENERLFHYLPLSCTVELRLIETVETALLLPFEIQLLENENLGCRVLFKDKKMEDLNRMYRLYIGLSRSLKPITSIFKQFITDEGTALVQQAEDAAITKAENAAGGSYEQAFVRKVIELYDNFMVYVKDCFTTCPCEQNSCTSYCLKNRTIFHKTLKEAFGVFLNKDIGGSSSAELLATFCDNILKKGGSEKLSDEAIEDSLEKVVKLVECLIDEDKDMFDECYRKKLSRRLLFDNSANDDHERSFLTKLKQQCGAQLTLKMQGMVTDLTLGRENLTKFEEYLGQNPTANPGLDLNVTVLTSHFWPSFKSSDLNLPSEMVRCVEVFKQFYQKVKGRKLSWVHSLGSCHIDGKFGQKTIEIIVGTYQAAALLLFNTADRLSYTEIAGQLNLDDVEMIRVLQSLSCEKYKILLKEPNTKTVSHTDQFSFNSGFTDRMRTIRIPLPPLDEIAENRKSAIETCIVLIMKRRVKLGHQQLITECFEQLSRMFEKFQPDHKAIEEKIESLITREYIERDKENPQLLRYMP